jgi:hypothetical protein
MNRPRFVFLATMILLAAFSRLLPHLPNFTPLTAIAHFADRRPSFFVPFAALPVSDRILRLHRQAAGCSA